MSNNSRTNNSWYGHTVEYYTAMQKTKLLIRALHDESHRNNAEWKKPGTKVHLNYFVKWSSTANTSMKQQKTSTMVKVKMVPTITDKRNKLTVIRERENRGWEIQEWRGERRLLWNYMKSSVGNLWKLWSTIKFKEFFTQKNNKMVMAFVGRELPNKGTKNLASELAGNTLYFVVVDILV